VGKGWLALLFVALLSGLAVLFRFDPATSNYYPRCVLHAVTGLHCPGCGSLRATHELLHGHVGRALAFNPLFVFSLPVLGLLALRRKWCYRVWVPWVTLMGLVAYGILRNIPAWPFVLLAPR
jgi:hypothetical protein